MVGGVGVPPYGGPPPVGPGGPPYGGPPPCGPGGPGGPPPSGPGGPGSPPPNPPNPPNGPGGPGSPNPGCPSSRGSSSHQPFQQPVYQSTYDPTGGYMPYQYYQHVEPNHQLLFVATLGLPHLSKLINDPIQHNHAWPPIIVKLPSDIPKFDGKQGYDPKNHVMTFHLWCSSNSLMDDSIRLRLF